jgi:hypothetical protein
MVNEHGGSEAVYHFTLLTGAEQVGNEAVLIAFVSLFFGKARSIVFNDVRALPDVASCVAAGCVDGR